MKIHLSWLGAWALGLVASCATAAMPIFDSHLHYSHDAWEQLPPKAAVDILRKAGLRGAMVSSSSDDGTQKLFAEAPDLVIPVLRPYRQRGEIRSGPLREVRFETEDGDPIVRTRWDAASPQGGRCLPEPGTAKIQLFR